MHSSKQSHRHARQRVTNLYMFFFRYTFCIEFVRPSGFRLVTIGEFSMLCSLFMLYRNFGKLRSSGMDELILVWLLKPRVVVFLDLKQFSYHYLFLTKSGVSLNDCSLFRQLPLRV